jgi:hypothetical protein
VSELELQLQALGRELEFPPTPDLVAAVRPRLERPPFPWRRVGVLALAVLLIALGAALLVPSARTAILRWLHIRGATVERVETLPRAVERSRVHGLGRALPLEQAERRVGFRMMLPPLKSPPRHAYVLEDSVMSVYLAAPKPVLLSEFKWNDAGALKKAAGPETSVEPALVNGGSAIWLAGRVHTLEYIDRYGSFHSTPVRVHGNVLVWNRGGLTLRLESRLTKAEALRLAERIR